MTAGQRRWLIFAVCATIVVAAMAFSANAVLRLEQAQHEANADAEHQATVRLALWRMDSWMAPVLAREAARAHTEYQSFYAPGNAYTPVQCEIRKGEVLTPSPLLTFRSQVFPLHFQCRGNTVTSPQVPTGDWRAVAEQSGWANTDFSTPARELESLHSALRPDELAAIMTAR